jgi:cysteinyl-tRNA synthetase
MKMPDHAVRASTAVDQAAMLIETLTEKGYAYHHKHKGVKNVYFDPLKFEGFGKLAHLDLSKWPKKKRRFHLDTYNGTPWNRGDFVLWHGCQKDDIVCWNSGVGRGRPAWNIQDASIVTKHLGFSIDVACGGIDNLVRHHDYTLAVAEAISGKSFARYWLHGGHLLVKGKKMSKSKGNVYYLEDLLARNYTRDHLRFFLIYGQYRKKMNFTWEKLAETSGKLDMLKSIVQDLEKTKPQSSSEEAKTFANKISSGFEMFMNKDLNVKAAFDEILKVVARLQELKKQNRLSLEVAKATLTNLKKIDSVLQVIF